MEPKIAAHTKPCDLACNSSGDSWSLFEDLHASRQCSHIARLDFETPYNLAVLFFASAACELRSGIGNCKAQFNGEYLRILVSFGRTANQRPVKLTLNFQSTVQKVLHFEFGEPTWHQVYNLPVASSAEREQLRSGVDFETVPQSFPSLVPVSCEAVVQFDGQSRKAIKKMPISISVATNLVTGTRPGDVFLSYAWNRPSVYLGAEDDLEAPVRAIVETIGSRPDVELIFDKTSLMPGDYLSDFLTLPSAESTCLLIAVVSRKYWRSWYCMKEFVAMLDTFAKSRRNERDSIIMIGHCSDLNETIGNVDELIAYWEKDEVLSYCPAFLKPEAVRLRKRIIHVIDNDLPRMCRDLQGIYRRWSSGDQLSIISWLNAELEKRFHDL